MAGEGRGNVEEKRGGRGRDKIQWQEKKRECRGGRGMKGKKRKG